MKLKAIVISTILLLIPVSGFSLGLGMTVGSGTEDWEDTWGLGNDYNHSGDRELSHFGFVIDSAVAKTTIFNYRLSIVSEDNNVVDDGDGLYMSGMALNNDFGFAVVRKRAFRMWVGPRVKLAVYDDLERVGSPNGVDTYGSVTGFGIGPVVGFNFNLPRVATFSITTGFLAMEYFGDYVAWNPSGLTRNTNDVETNSISSFINISVLFRVRDQYRGDF
ncbi:MAG: hypothetical protein OEZ68_16060 [Gammaproteobacteria bacterium]|nr:hypothetical protein [Gammaproteobacteria bacterium]MDH5802317.1 hypothetical protein [Gammaproteobacteria bacterium]